MNTKILLTDSIQELARFWDTHDLTDLEQELEEVTEPVFERETVVSIRLPVAKVKAIEEVARAKGINYTDLIREWLVEKVHNG